MENLTELINSFGELEENWDGYGGIPVIKDIIDITLKLIEDIGNHKDKIDDIFPNSHGTITIEWITNSNEKLVLEIGVNNYSYFLAFDDFEPKIMVNGNCSILNDIDQLIVDLDILFFLKRK